MKSKTDFRHFEQPAKDSVREFYRLNHQHQTLAFAEAKLAHYSTRKHALMGIWEACEWLDQLVDDSDPDTELSQLQHALQTAEMIRADGHPDWFILTGLIHDLGKVLCAWGEPQWAVVGDTFPLGVRFSDKIVYPEFFELNPDSQNEEYQSEFGIYEPGCGLDKVVMSFGHDEYLYQVTKEYLPEPALYMIRYHSFYACHQEGAYGHLMNENDRKQFDWVRVFNPYDLYSKSTTVPDVQSLAPWYQALIKKYFPSELRW